MKSKFCRVFFLCAGVLTVTLSACGNKSEAVTSLPEEGLKTTVTLTMAPTLTPTTTPEPAETATEIPMAEDTYEKGMIQNEFFASEWMNLRFTSQPGFEFGSREEVEMYARYGEEAMVEVYTQRLTKEEQNLTEEEYLQVLFEKLLSGYENARIVQQGDVIKGNIGTEEYIGVENLIDDGTGNFFYRNYIVRKKESRMIVISISRIYSGASRQSVTNFIMCFGAYDDPPVYLPEELLAPGPFTEGVVTDAGYENEWLNLRIALPEDGTLVKNDISGVDSLALEVMQEEQLLQLYVVYGEGITVEDNLFQYAGAMESNVTNMVEAGYTFYCGNETETVLIGGQEYVKLSIQIANTEKTAIVDFYSRKQDDYLITLCLGYEDGYENEAEEMLSFFRTY